MAGPRLQIDLDAIVDYQKNLEQVNSELASIEVFQGRLSSQIGKATFTDPSKFLPDQIEKTADVAKVLENANWSKYATDLEGLIRVNLRGREPMGIVEPGADYEALLDRIEAEVRALVEPSTGQPVVADVLRTDRVFPGPRRDYLPDLIVVWERAAPVTTVSSAAVGAVAAPSRPGLPPGRPGRYGAVRSASASGCSPITRTTDGRIAS